MGGGWSQVYGDFYQQTPQTRDNRSHDLLYTQCKALTSQWLDYSGLTETDRQHAGLPLGFQPVWQIAYYASITQWLSNSMQELLPHWYAALLLPLIITFYVRNLRIIQGMQPLSIFISFATASAVHGRRDNWSEVVLSHTRLGMG